MFSSRLDWNLERNAISRRLAEKRTAGAQILDLTESNPTKAGIAMPEGLLEVLTDGRALRYEPEPAGLRDAREAVSEYYGRRVEPERIVLTTSTSEAYGFLFKLLTDARDEVMTPRPSYPLFEYLAGLELVSSVPYRLGMDREELEAAASERTRAIVTVNPNNPTGGFLNREERARLVEFCERRRMAIIADEVFADYGFGESEARVKTLTDEERVLTFSLSGLSKAAGLPQMKLGWIVVSGPAELRRAALERLELIADTYLAVGTPVQWGARKLLAAGAGIRELIRERTRRNLESLRGAIGENSPFRLIQPEGGWYAVIQAPRIRSEEQWAMDLLEQENVLVQPGYFFDFEREAYLVLSLLTPEEEFGEGVRRLVMLEAP